MKTVKINFGGKEYPMCFSTRVIKACNDKYGGVENISDVLTGNVSKSLDESLWLLSIMLDAGERYAKLNGEEPQKAPAIDDLYDMYDADDLVNIVTKIKATITGGMTVTVETAAPKNMITTPEKN